MKILQVIPYFAPRFGGDVAVAFALSRELVSMGHECTLLTSDYKFDKEYAASLEKFGINIVPLHCSFNISMLFFTPKIRTWLHENLNGFDIVHLHDYRSFQNNAVYTASKKWNVPYVMQPHGSTPRIMGKKLFKWLWDVVYGFRVIKSAAHIIAVSQEEAGFDEDMRGGGKNISVIYNGMDLHHFENNLSKGSFKQKWNINGKMILYLGRLHRSKGIDFALQGFKQFAEDVDTVTFVIAGPDDGYGETLKKLVARLGISDRVRFTGILDESEKYAALREADLFLHTVRFMGGVGIAPLEAILSGTPVIVTDECGEIIRKSDCGYVVEFGDSKDLTQKMRQVFSEPEENGQMVDRGRDYIREHLTWKKVSRKVEKIYLNAIKKNM